MRLALALGAAVALTPVAAAAGDPEAGAAVFQRQCSNCHVVRNEAGEVLAGRNAQQGPNLYGVIGRQAGTYPNFRYGESLVQAGQAGLVWDEASFLAYVENPNAFLRSYLNNNRARGNMAFQLRDATQRADVYAFLATFSPAPAEEPAEEEATEEAPAEGETPPPASGN
jgi:cytochrome c